MIKFFIDHNIEGQAELLWGALASEGWLDLLPLKAVTFQEVKFPIASNDQEVWRFAQSNNMILLTDNRNMQVEDSLEQTIRNENTASSFPVITIGSLARLDEKLYRVQCATRIAEIVVDLENFIGTGRFISHNFRKRHATSKSLRQNLRRRATLARGGFTASQTW